MFTVYLIEDNVYLVEVDGLVSGEHQNRVYNSVSLRHLDNDKLPRQQREGRWVALATEQGRKEGYCLFNDALNTFYLRL